MKAIILVFTLLLISSGCKNDNQNINTSTKKEFIYGNEIKDSPEKLLKIFKVKSTSALETVPPPLISCVSPVGRSNLDGYKMVIKMFNGKTDAGISIPGFTGMKLGSEEISYSVYYVEPKIIVCNGEQKVYGVGYSMHILIKKLKKGLTLDKLPSVAASVQIENGKTEVFYSLQSYGITGIPIVKFFKPVINKPFDVEGFNIMQSSIDGIHEFLSDATLSSHLSFTPQELTFIKPNDLQ